MLSPPNAAEPPVYKALPMVLPPNACVLFVEFIIVLPAFLKVVDPKPPVVFFRDLAVKPRAFSFSLAMTLLA